MKKTKNINIENIKTKNMNPKTYLAIAFFLVALVCMSGIASAMTHPCLLFENIEDTPGYQHRTESPWSSWETNVITIATNTVLPKDFSDPSWPSYNNIRYRAAYARDAALAYQITKDATFADKAQQALLNLDVGDVRTGLSGKSDKKDALFSYSLTYDWTQPYLSAINDTFIRDKLAKLSDDVYYDLNDGGTSLDYINIVDYHGPAYPIMGIAGCVLSDYTNPNGLSFNSTPSDWLKVGTEYLFENDLLHSYLNKSLVDWEWDNSGKCLYGDYKTYVIDELSWWFQIYSHFNSTNIFDEYPIAKRIMTSELWESMPNHYHNNFEPSGNTKFAYHRGIINLLDADSKAYMLNHDDIIDASSLLPYSKYSLPSADYWEYTGGFQRLLYLVYEDYAYIERKNPSWTSHLGETSANNIFRIFRGSWENDSDWLSFITQNFDTKSNRNMAHHDQLSFEYYSKGDLLLADGGEIKYITDTCPMSYGLREFGHNCVLIEDPRTPFDKLNTFADNCARGIFKGQATGLKTPVTLNNVILSDYMEVLDTEATITSVVGDIEGLMTYDGITLSTPINYKRTILYPEDYFIVIDKLEGNEPWIYRNLFRFSSLNIIPSTGKTESEVGHVNGDLTIGDTPYDWLSLSFNAEQTPE